METEQEKKDLKQSIWEIVRFVLIALVIVIPIRLYIIEPFVVSGSSMFPTFQNGDYLIVDKFSYELGNPQRDDVVVFRYPNDPSKFFIKRIIGLPNETVDIKGDVVTITNATHTTGFKLTEPYAKDIFNSDTHFVLSGDQYFVMGDNRNNSSDSRVWGAVPRNLMIGRAFLRLLPLNKINILPGQYKQTE